VNERFFIGRQSDSPSVDIIFQYHVYKKNRQAIPILPSLLLMWREERKFKITTIIQRHRRD
jgi:hypothetical protein